MSALHPLRQWRQAKNIEQGELAKRANMAQSYLCEIEKWKKEPSLKLANLLSRLTNYEVEVSDFVKSIRGKRAA